MIDREVAGDPGKQINVGLADGLRERHALSDLHGEFFRRRYTIHVHNSSCMCPDAVQREAVRRCSGTAKDCNGPGSAPHYCVLRRARDTHAPSSVLWCTCTTQSRASAEISAAVKPSSARTSCVCAPNGCGGRRTLAALPSYRTG